MLSKFIWIIITFFKIPGFWFLSRSLFFFISFSAASFAVAWNDKELSRISRGISCGSVSKCVEVVLMLFFSSSLVFLSFVCYFPRNSKPIFSVIIYIESLHSHTAKTEWMGETREYDYGNLRVCLKLRRVHKHAHSLSINKNCLCARAA